MTGALRSFQRLQSCLSTKGLQSAGCERQSDQLLLDRLRQTCEDPWSAHLAVFWPSDRREVTADHADEMTLVFGGYSRWTGDRANAGN